MKLNLDLPTPLQYFTSLVQSDAHFPLLEAAISLAQDEYPELDVQQVLSDVDQLQARLKRRVPADASALQKLRLLGKDIIYEEILLYHFPDRKKAYEEKLKKSQSLYKHILENDNKNYVCVCVNPGRSGKRGGKWRRGRRINGRLNKFTIERLLVNYQYSI